MARQSLDDVEQTLQGKKKGELAFAFEVLAEWTSTNHIGNKLIMKDNKRINLAASHKPSNDSETAYFGKICAFYRMR